SPRLAPRPTSSGVGARSFRSSSSSSPTRSSWPSRSGTSTACSCSSRRKSRSERSSGRARCSPPKQRSTGSRSSPADGFPPGSHQPRGLGEELQPHRGQQVLVPGPPEGPQDADSPGRRGALQREGGGRQRRAGSAEAEAPRLPQGREARLEEGHRAAARRRPHRDLRGGSRLMALRKYKPTSPGRRFRSVSSFEEVTKREPEKSLVEPVKRKGGRNNQGRITTRHQGGGHKRRYRTIDFKRLKDGVPAKVAAIEYDPNRSARIALLHYADGAKSYILAPARLQVGAVVESGPSADIKPGNALPLENIPTGTLVHNV